MIDQHSCDWVSFVVCSLSGGTKRELRAGIAEIFVSLLHFLPSETVEKAEHMTSLVRNIISIVANMKDASQAEVSQVCILLDIEWIIWVIARSSYIFTANLFLTTCLFFFFFFFLETLGPSRSETHCKRRTRRSSR